MYSRFGVLHSSKYDQIPHFKVALIQQNRFAIKESPIINERVSAVRLERFTISFIFIPGFLRRLPKVYFFHPMIAVILEFL